MRLAYPQLFVTDSIPAPGWNVLGFGFWNVLIGASIGMVGSTPEAGITHALSIAYMILFGMFMNRLGFYLFADSFWRRLETHVPAVATGFGCTLIAALTATYYLGQQLSTMLGWHLLITVLIVSLACIPRMFFALSYPVALVLRAILNPVSHTR